MSDTLSAQQDIHLHAYVSDSFSQLDKRLSEVGTTKQIKPSSKNIFTNRSKAILLIWIIFLFMFCVYHTFLPSIGALWSPAWKGLTSWLACM